MAQILRHTNSDVLTVCTHSCTPYLPYMCTHTVIYSHLPFHTIVHPHYTFTPTATHTPHPHTAQSSSPAFLLILALVSDNWLFCNPLHHFPSGSAGESHIAGLTLASQCRRLTQDPVPACICSVVASGDGRIWRTKQKRPVV